MPSRRNFQRDRRKANGNGKMLGHRCPVIWNHRSGIVHPMDNIHRFSLSDQLGYYRWSQSRLPSFSLETVHIHIPNLIIWVIGFCGIPNSDEHRHAAGNTLPDMVITIVNLPDRLEKFVSIKVNKRSDDCSGLHLSKGGAKSFCVPSMALILLVQSPVTGIYRQV